MDEEFVARYLKERKVEFIELDGDVIFNSLQRIEYLDIEEIKDELFKKRLDYFVLAKCLKEKMHLESSYRQLKRYFVSVKGMNGDEAKLCANKYNRACRTYDKFTTIMKNVSSFPKIDIRDLNINQLHMAVNLDWLHRLNAIQLRSEPITKDPTVLHSTIDWADVESSMRCLQNCDWYKKAKSNPSEMAYIFNIISSRAIQDARHSSLHS